MGSKNRNKKLVLNLLIVYLYVLFNHVKYPDGV